MKTITVFGASGRTGQEIRAAADKRGICVRAYDKKKSALDELRIAIRGADGVVIVFGPRPPYAEIFCAEATKHIIRAMEAEGVRRLICQTGAMIGDYAPNRSFFFKIMSGSFRKSNPQGYQDRVEQEEMVMKSALDWTIVKPPRLTMSQKDLKVKAGENTKVGLLSSASRKSVAKFMINELLCPEHLGQAVFLKN